MEKQPEICHASLLCTKERSPALSIATGEREVGVHLNIAEWMCPREKQCEEDSRRVLVHCRIVGLVPEDLGRGIDFGSDEGLHESFVLGGVVVDDRLPEITISVGRTAPLGDRENLAASEVGNLDHKAPSVPDEDVVRFDVAMNDALSVEESNGTKDLNRRARSVPFAERLVHVRRPAEQATARRELHHEQHTPRRVKRVEELQHVLV